MFLIVGLFPLTSGRRACSVNTTSYNTAVACFQTIPIPAILHTPPSSDDTVLQDGTVAFLVGKLFIPPPHAHTPIAIDAVEIAPIPGDPSDSPSYRSCIPHYPVPTIIAEGTVAAANCTDHSAVLAFPLAVSDYVRSNMAPSTILFVSLLSLHALGRPHALLSQLSPL
jgi:hypothetical protein